MTLPITTQPARSSADTHTKMQQTNGDEETLKSDAEGWRYIGNFHKGLPHNALGEVDEAAYDALLTAVQTRDPAKFAAIPKGLQVACRKFVSPQAGLATDLQVELPGAYPPGAALPSWLTLAPPPNLDSAEAAAEAVELYWMALLRDVPFAEFNDHQGIAHAVKELSGLRAVQDFHASRKDTEGYTKRDYLRHSPVGVVDQDGCLSPATIFRGATAGDHKGPFVSQFLLKDVPFGSLLISNRQQTVLPGRDYLTTFEIWRQVQDGAEVSLTTPSAIDTERRYMRSMRDLAHYVHIDQLYEAYLNACLLLLSLNADVDDGNPYKEAKGKTFDPQNQMGFATFGGPHILSLVTEVATRALQAVWYQKWFVHRRLRPEAYGGLVHLKLRGTRNYPLHPDVLNAEAVHLIGAKHGSYLLPMAFPEGSPVHPAYGAGHATVAGACVTILKAWFDEDFVLPDPVVANADGTALEPYRGSDANELTVGGELNKVAANISVGRNMAGVHWRTDYSESVKLGEAVAIRLLQKQSTGYNERLRTGQAMFTSPPSFSLTRFDGVKVKIADGEVTVISTPEGGSSIKPGDVLFL